MLLFKDWRRFLEKTVVVESPGGEGGGALPGICGGGGLNKGCVMRWGRLRGTMGFETVE